MLRDEAIDVLRTAEVLLGRSSRTLAERREAARKLVALGSRAVVVKGEHPDEDATDIYWNGSEMVELPAMRISTANTRGAIEFALEPGHGHVPVTPMFGFLG